MQIAIGISLTLPLLTGGGGAPAESFGIELEAGDRLVGETGDVIQQEAAP